MIADEEPTHAALAPRKKRCRDLQRIFLYLVCLHEGTGVDAPDFLAVVDTEKGQVVHRLPMPNAGDELHHFGWNACSSHARPRRYLILPGLVSGRIHVVDTADPKAPKLHKVIEPDEVVRKTKLTGPHTVHCLSDGRIMISMLGDEKLNGPGGFLLLDEKFDVAGRWETGATGCTSTTTSGTSPGTT